MRAQKQSRTLSGESDEGWSDNTHLPTALVLMLIRTTSPSPAASISAVPASPVIRVAHTNDASPWAAIVPAWVGAVATVGLLIGAIVTAIFAIKAFHKQSKEVDLLQRQLADQQMFNRKQSGVLDLQAEELKASLDARNQAAAQWRWEYASTIVAWLDEPESSGAGWLVVGHVQNTGERPIRDVSVWWCAAGSPIRDREELTACFLPHAQKDFDCRVEGAAISSGLEAIVQFRTVGDDWWSAGTDGRLASGLQPGRKGLQATEE